MEALLNFLYWCFCLPQVPFVDALELVRSRKVYLENVSSLTKSRDANLFRKDNNDVQVAILQNRNAFSLIFYCKSFQILFSSSTVIFLFWTLKTLSHCSYQWVPITLGVYFSQCCWKFSCSLYYTNVHHREDSSGQELTYSVLLIRR